MPTIDEIDARLRTVEQKLADAIPEPEYWNSLNDSDLLVHVEALLRKNGILIKEKPDGTIYFVRAKSTQVLLET